MQLCHGILVGLGEGRQMRSIAGRVVFNGVLEVSGRIVQTVSV